MYKIRYVFLISLITSYSPASAVNFRYIVNGISRTVRDVVEAVNDWRTIKKSRNLVARNIVYTAFGYSKDNSKYQAPQYRETQEDLERVLRNDSRFINSLGTLREIVTYHNINVTPSPNTTEQWNDLRSIVALEHAVYPADAACSRKDIHQDTKRSIAIGCLLAIDEKFLEQKSVSFLPDDTAFSKAAQVGAILKEKKVISVKSDTNSEINSSKTQYISSSQYEMKDL